MYVLAAITATVAPMVETDVTTVTGDLDVSTTIVDTDVGTTIVDTDVTTSDVNATADVTAEYATDEVTGDNEMTTAGWWQENTAHSDSDLLTVSCWLSLGSKLDPNVFVLFENDDEFFIRPR